MKNMRNMLRATMFTPGLNNGWGIQTLLESAPGMGKTSIINALREEGLYTFTLLGSIREPTDVLGLGIEVNGVIKRCPEEWVADVVRKGRAVIFMDEANTAPPQTQAAFLRLVLERMAGDTKLPNTVRFIGAQNPTAMAANGYDHSPAMANRWCHVKWVAPTADEWGDWLLGKSDADFGQDNDSDINTFDDTLAEMTERKVLAAWPEAWATARGLAASFLAARPELLHKMPDLNDPKASAAWPSHRTWEMAARVLAGATIHGLTDEETDELIAGCVGVGPAAEFAAFRVRQDLPKPADVLEGRVSFEHDPMRLDRTMAVLKSCVAMVVDPQCPNRAQRVNTMWTMLNVLYDHAADLVTGPATSLLRAGLGRGPLADAVLAKIDTLLRMSGTR